MLSLSLQDENIYTTIEDKNTTFSLKAFIFSPGRLST